jgi:hypothetical protein
MAMSMDDSDDPYESPVIREVHPKPFELDKLDPEKVVVDYDRPSDSLGIHLFGRYIDTMSVPATKNIYVMVALGSEESVGLHIEGFLSQMVEANPSSIELLSYAELRGITPAEVWALQRDVHKNGKQFAAVPEGAVGDRLAGLRKQAIESFLNAELSRKWPLAPAMT